MNDRKAARWWGILTLVGGFTLMGGMILAQLGTPYGAVMLVLAFGIGQAAGVALGDVE